MRTESILVKKVREKSRECHNHKPQPFPDPRGRKKTTNPNKLKSNKRTKSTKISSLFPKRGNRNTRRTEKHKNKMTHGKTCNKPNLETKFRTASELKIKIRASKTSLRPFNSLIVSRRFLCCTSSLFVRIWVNMWSLYCSYLILISPSFGASGRLCFVIVAFPGYRHLYFCILHSFFCISYAKNAKILKHELSLEHVLGTEMSSNELSNMCYNLQVNGKHLDYSTFYGLSLMI